MITIMSMMTMGHMGHMFNWYNQWYPIGIQKFMDKSKPYKSVVLDVPLVTWYDKKSGHWSTVLDRCPHRGAPLSEGRIEGCNIECPYHGYQFNGCGDCRYIPHLLDKNNSSVLSKMNTKALITDVSEDIVWIWMNSSRYPDSDPPMYIDSDPDGILVEDYVTKLPFDFRYLQENIMDVSHTSFTHHGTQSDRKFATPIEYKLWDDISMNGFSLISRNYPEEEFTRYNRFISPVFHVTSIKRNILGVTFNNTLVTYGLPIRKGESQVISRFIIENMNGNKVMCSVMKCVLRLMKGIPVWYRHMLVGEFVEDDIVMLNSMQMYNVRDNRYRMVASADTPVIMWNIWLSKYGNYSGVFRSKYVSKIDLMNRYDRHTKDCVVCKNAKVRLKTYRVVLCMMLMLSVMDGYLGLSMILFGVLLFISKKITLFDVGVYPPKRNRV
jgi:phenylpropionate dioxygenase-like ring-hydroxylating dioxygenase large terminal subunit